MKISRFIPTFLVVLMTLCITPLNLVIAKDLSVEIPANASAKSYGDGWNCDSGYRESKGGCAAIKIPTNAYSTNKSYGKGWECKRGFKQSDKVCSQVKVPKNGYLDYSGIRIRCNRGYLMNKKACELIIVPENGYLEVSSYDPGWKCDRGYKVDSESCIALNLPANAHVGYSGNEWECDKPYIKKRNVCISPKKY